MSTYEIWITEDSACCFGSECHHERATEMQESGARLIHRFEAETLEDFKSKHSEFMRQWEQDPKNTETINLPASHFQIAEYPCGLKVGDVLYLEDVYEENRRVGPKGARFRVTPGDKNIPHTVFMRRLDCELDYHHHVEDTSPFFKLYRKEEKLER